VCAKTHQMKTKLQQNWKFSTTMTEPVCHLRCSLQWGMPQPIEAPVEPDGCLYPDGAHWREPAMRQTGLSLLTRTSCCRFYEKAPHLAGRCVLIQLAIAFVCDEDRFSLQTRSHTRSLQLRHGHNEPQLIISAVHVGMLLFGTRQHRRTCLNEVLAIHQFQG